MLNPVKNHILIRMVDKDEAKEKRTPGGVIIPGTVMDRGRTRRAKIIKMGPDANKRIDYKVVEVWRPSIGSDGKPKYELVRFEADYADWKVGETVLVHWYAGTYMDGLTSLDDAGYADIEEYRLISGEEIVGRWAE